MDSKEAQDKEISAALEVSGWDDWASSIQSDVDKLFADSKTMRLSVMAIGAVAVVAVGVSAATGKLVKTILDGVNQLATQQQQMGQVLEGLLPKTAIPGPIPMGPISDPPVVPRVSPDFHLHPVDDSVPVIRAKDKSEHDPTIATDVIVAPAVMGPESGTSDAQRELMASDAEMIAMAKHAADPLAVNEGAVNLDSKNNNKG